MPRDEHFEYVLPPILDELDLEKILKQIPKIKLEPCYWDELEVGDKTSLHIKVTRKIILLYAMLSNDYNPIHVDLDYGKKTFFKTNIAHGILVASFGSGVVGSNLVGEGVALMSINNLNFKDAVKIDDRIVVSAEIIKKYYKEIKGKNRYFIDIDLKVVNEDTKSIATDAIATVTVFNKSRPKS
ncbi:MAG: MaoC family dehydratase [Candidatus Helarchaeota archaeon]